MVYVAVCKECSGADLEYNKDDKYFKCNNCKSILKQEDIDLCPCL